MPIDLVGALPSCSLYPALPDWEKKRRPPSTWLVGPLCLVCAVYLQGISLSVQTQTGRKELVPHNINDIMYFVGSEPFPGS